MSQFVYKIYADKNIWSGAIHVAWLLYFHVLGAKHYK